MIEQLKGRPGWAAQGHDLSMISRCYECLRAEQWTQRGVSPQLRVWPEGFSFRENGFQLHDHHSNPLWLGSQHHCLGHNNFTTQRVRVWESNNCEAAVGTTFFLLAQPADLHWNSSLDGKKRDYKSNFWCCMLNYRDLHCWNEGSRKFNIQLLLAFFFSLAIRHTFVEIEFEFDNNPF